MQPPSVTFQNKQYRIFLACLALSLVIVGAVVTSRYGAGVASDSVNYMAIAQNLVDGKGLSDHLGQPLLSWPPLYPILLAGLHLLTGLDVFIVGWHFNLVLLGVNLFLSGLIFQRVFSGQLVYAYLSTIFVFLSLSSMRIHATVGSDALYLTMTLALLLVADAYLINDSCGAYWMLVLLSALAPLQRYVGLAITVTALTVIFFKYRGQMRLMFRDAIPLGFISALPIFWWIVLHNILTYGSLWGPTAGQVVDVGQNISLALTKMLHWFVPYLNPIMPLLTRPILVLGGLGLILILINFRSVDNWLAWVRAFTDASTYPMMIQAFVYFSAVALTINTADHRFLQSDRYYVILLVPVMVVIFLTYDHLIRPHLKLTARQLTLGLGAVFVIWSLYPLYSAGEYISKALERGEPSDYNLFNTRAFHEMPVVAEMKKLRDTQPDAPIYSNYADAVWFYTRRPVLPLPTRDVSDLATAYSGWPGDRSGYIVWFKPNEYKHYLAPEELSQFAVLAVIYTDPSGDIYSVRAR